MIVCLRCGHENADGRNLCQRCRAYLGWAKPAAGPADLGAPARQPGGAQPGGAHPGAIQAAPAPAPLGDPVESSRPAAIPAPAPQKSPPRAPVSTAPTPQLPAQFLPPARQPSPPERRAEPPTTSPGRRPTPPPIIAPGSAAPRQVTLGQLQPIPTVIADTPARYQPTSPPSRDAPGLPGSQPFEALRPDATGHAASTADRRGPGTDMAAHGLLTADIARETGVRCPNCGRISPAGRRFCRCGATLAAVVALPQWEDPEPGLPWYRRLEDGIGAGSRFWRSMRHANRGVRARFNRGQSLKNRAVKLLAVAGVGAVGVGMLGPWGGPVRSQAWQRVSNVLPWSYTTVAATGATTDPVTQHPLDGFAPANADDLNSGTAWATPFTPPLPGRPCARPSGAARLVITFASPVAVDRVTVLPGMPATSFDRTQQSRPRTLDVLLSNGTCKPMTLTDTPAGQSIDISGRNIDSITISVIDVFPGSVGSPTAALVAITEVTAAHR